MKKNIPILIKNIIYPNKVGIYSVDKFKIYNENSNKEFIKSKIFDISEIKNLITIYIKYNKNFNFSYFNHFFQNLSFKEIKIFFIIHNILNNYTEIIIEKKYLYKIKKIIKIEFLKEIENNILFISIKLNTSILSIKNIKKYNSSNEYDILYSIIKKLNKNNFFIKSLIKDYNNNINIITKQKKYKEKLNRLKYYDKDSIKKINLFIIGVGKVGNKLFSQILSQNNYLIKKLKLDIRIIAIANSKTMYFNESGINIKNWKKKLEFGSLMNLEKFIEKVYSLSFSNSIFIDNTDSEKVSEIYDKFLSKKIGIVTCNKIACSSSYKYYKKLKKLSKLFNTPFLFETNVGAGLPIINTLNDLINSGDKILEIEAVLSGSLNFIFNNFKEGYMFSDIVKKAYKEGYTEPDPRIDLSGIDVMRKILILVRECGKKIELNDIIQKSFLPKDCRFTKNIQDFYKILTKYEEHFIMIRKEAEKSKKRLRFIAKYKNKITSIGLENVDSNHPFYNLDGKDNIILYKTKRYLKQPLIIKGSGAGPEVTASGIFSDIIKASR